MSKLKPNETDIKRTLRDYLAVKGIYNYALLQGLGSARGLPDRVMHFDGRVHYLEVKTPTGKLSPYQEAFRDQCSQDFIPYHVIRSLEDLQHIVEGYV